MTPERCDSQLGACPFVSRLSVPSSLLGRPLYGSTLRAVRITATSCQNMRNAFAELPVHSAIFDGGLCLIDQGVARTSGAS